LAGTARQLPVWRDSESLFSHALAVTRDNAIAHVNLGVAYEGQGRAEAAMREYQSALGINPSLAEVHNNLGNLLESAGRTNEALAQFLEAVRLKPGAPLSHDNLATLLVRMGRYDEAMRQYAEAAGLDPRDPRPDYLMGKALLRQGRSREAVRCFREALRLDANHLRSLVCLARVLASDPDARARNGPEAVTLAQQALAIAGGKVALLLDTLGMAYAEAGRFEEAEAAARQAIEQAQAGGETAAVGALRERLKLYESRRPWRASPGDDRE
jgi:tetratricopeptide (TPR) repeat protein